MRAEQNWKGTDEDRTEFKGKEMSTEQNWKERSEDWPNNINIFKQNWKGIYGKKGWAKDVGKRWKREEERRGTEMKWGGKIQGGKEMAKFNGYRGNNIH